MGHSKAEKSDSRERILEIAARRFRERGVDGLGIAELMEEAGLTHGGFYRHFASREDLVAQAIERALQQNAGRMARRAARAPKSALSNLLETYLSLAHRDSPGDGCTVVSLAADLARGESRARTAYTDHVRQFIELLISAQGNGTSRAARRRAIATLSAMVGALALARAVNDDALSAEILHATLRALKDDAAGAT